MNLLEWSIGDGNAFSDVMNAMAPIFILGDSGNQAKLIRFCQIVTTYLNLIYSNEHKMSP
jgi:hypothetical protein